MHPGMEELTSSGSYPARMMDRPNRPTPRNNHVDLQQRPNNLMAEIVDCPNLAEDGFLRFHEDVPNAGPRGHCA